MILISILIILLYKAIPKINNNLTDIQYTRISAIVLSYALVLSLNTFYYQELETGIGIYSGYFNVTVFTQFIDMCLYLFGIFIISTWPLYSNKNQDMSNSSDNEINNLESELLLKGSLSTKSSEEIYGHVIKDISSKTSTDIGSYLSSTINLNPYKDLAKNYSVLIFFNLLGCTLLISSSDLISMYISIELQSFSLYILATLIKEDENSTSAGLKYFLLGGLASSIILLGSGLIYSNTGLTNLESIYSIISVNTPYSSNSVILGLTMGLVCIFVGFLFKIAAAPLHNWAPDVYNDTPTIVTIWLIVMPKISILLFLLELHTQVSSLSDISIFTYTLNFYNGIINDINNISVPQYFLWVSQYLKSILLITSFLSLVIGSLLGLVQTQIKRLLAYSTISHIGFILLSLSINSEQSIDSLIFYIVSYSITNLNIFLIILLFGYIINQRSQINSFPHLDIKLISELKGMFFLYPCLVISLTISLFSLAGIPPLLGFFSKQLILYSAVQNGNYFISIIGILTSVISASYYLKLISVMYKEEDQTSTLLKSIESKIMMISSDNSSIINNLHSYIISMLTLSILLFIFKSSIILNSTQLLSLSLFYY